MRYNFWILVVLVLVLWPGKYACAQRVYATKQTSFPTNKEDNTEVKDPEHPISFPNRTDRSRIRVNGSFQTAYQILSFPQQIIGKTPITVRLKRKSDVSLLDIMFIEPMLGSNPQTPVYSGSTLVNLFKGSDENEITFIPDTEYDGIRIKLSTSLFSLDTEVEVFYAFYLEPPQVATEPVTVCQGDPAELSVTNVQAGYTYRWYTTPTGGTPFVESSTGTCNTPPVSTPTTFYVEAVENNDTEAVSARVPVEVNVTPKPVLAAITDQYLCSGQVLNLSSLNPIDTNGSSSGTYQWSLSSGGQPLKFTTITPYAGTSTYWVRYTYNNCFDETSVRVITSPKPAPIMISISNN
ncbi:MAG TPA: hypothetical protein VGD90_10620 [Sphingobacteriaceae bacterium]